MPFIWYYRQRERERARRARPVTYRWWVKQGKGVGEASDGRRWAWRWPQLLERWKTTLGPGTLARTGARRCRRWVSGILRAWEKAPEASTCDDEDGAGLGSGIGAWRRCTMWANHWHRWRYNVGVGEDEEGARQEQERVGCWRAQRNETGTTGACPRVGTRHGVRMARPPCISASATWLARSDELTCTKMKVGSSSVDHYTRTVLHSIDY
jgi:hypothetical protein